jgi:hypothetical protein
MILRNQIRCHKCKDEPCSTERQELVMCECGAVGVDGGIDYLKRIGDPADMKDISIHLPSGVVSDLVDAIEQVSSVPVKSRPQSLSVLCKIARTLRDYGRGT